MKILINKEVYKDKVYACWLGKNIGGTMGAPYEGSREMNDIHGYNSPKGEPLPNDDLDLQLVWLLAMEKVGPTKLDANTLAWYWRYIYPHWNEYGTGKNNLRVGLLPPLSGEFKNEAWKHSNGAWIRSEVWACLAPGYPEIAMKYAIMDASVDHGISEGTIAEMFTAALESLAFLETDVKTVINKALQYIPENSRVTKSVKLVIDEYNKKTPWKEVRQKIVEENKDLGWFQAPGNIAFTVLGLLYGEGDLLQSLIYAINCGDDTDCTGATVGAILGILGGTKAIPTELSEYIGDRIITGSLDGSCGEIPFPKSCTELSERVIRLMPTVMLGNTVEVEYVKSESSELILEKSGWPFEAHLYKEEFDRYLARSPYSFDINEQGMCVTVEFNSEPVIKKGESIELRVRFRNWTFMPQWLKIKVYQPEGWDAEYTKSVQLLHHTNETYPEAFWNLKITATDGEVEAVNRIPIVVEVGNFAMPVTIPLVLLG